MRRLIKRWKYKRELKRGLDPKHQAWLAHEWRELAFTVLAELLRYRIGNNIESIDKIVAEFNEKKLTLK